MYIQNYLLEKILVFLLVCVADEVFLVTINFYEQFLLQQAVQIKYKPIHNGESVL